ncbi:MAG: type IV secretion protein IcmB [Alphaproteobacteria bacterium]
MIGFLDELLAAVLLTIRQPIEAFIELETADDENTLATRDGSLVSYIRILGSRQIIGDAEYQWLVDQFSVKLGSRFDRPGHALQFYFMRDPAAIGVELDRAMRPNRTAARSIGLDLDDLLGERKRNLSRYLVMEDIYLVLWTRPSILSATDRKKANKERGEKKWPLARRAQHPYSGLELLRTRHNSYISSVTASMDELGIKCRLVNAHDALSAVRTSIYPNMRHDNWRANLPGDPLTARPQKKKKDYSDILWPPLRQQICVGDARVIDGSTVKVGPYCWTPVDMILAPAEPSPFPQLLARMIDSDTPFRMSFLIEGGGMHGGGLRQFFAGVLAFSNSENLAIKTSMETLHALSQNEAVVKLRLSFATFAPADDKKLLETRASALTQSIESWGYCQATSAGGDPLECTMSSALGVSCASTAPAVIAPLREIAKMLPWQRGSSPFEEGSVLFRTADGRMWPYQPGSALTTTWFDLIFAQPGAGKSVLLNALNLGTCLSAGTAKLPFIAILDIGPSSSGLISLLRDALPLDRRYEATHFKLRMTPDYAINPFDTQLGCRYPLVDERAYLAELLTLLCTPPGQAAPYDGMTQLVGLCIDEMFRWRDDKGANTEARPYLKHIEPEVDEAIARYDVHLHSDPYWWEVVDAMHERGLTHEATLAQRHAVPTLVDAVTAARRPQIRALLEETQIGASAESVIHAFERMVASAVREFPILASITRFDIGASRVTAVDLQDVAPQGDEIADRQTAIMYMLARHALIRQWWLGPEAIKYIPELYREYHELRIREIRETPKRISFDEFHRTSKTPAVRNQVIRDVREGRKWGVQVVLASQLLDDFSQDMVDLATGVWICGAAVSDRAIAATAERFGLSDTARWVMRYRLTGPRASGAPVLLILGTNEGRYEQHLINTLGPIELWALSTSAEDVTLRTKLYSRIGAARARRLLAMFFQGGTARQEIRRRIINRTERGEIEGAATTTVIEEIATEIQNYALQEQQKAVANQ